MNKKRNVPTRGYSYENTPDGMKIMFTKDQLYGGIAFFVTWFELKRLIERNIEESMKDNIIGCELPLP